MGVSKILGYLVGGTRIPYSQGGAEYPRGVHNILGYMEWGCQISWDAKYTVTPGTMPPCGKSRSLIVCS